MRLFLFYPAAMFCLAALLAAYVHGGTAAPDTERTMPGYKTADRKLKFESVGGVTTFENSGLVEMQKTVAPSGRIIIPVRLPEKGGLVINTGRGRESFSVSTAGNSALKWQYNDVTGMRKSSVWTGNELNLAEKLRQNFSFDDAILEWTDYFRSLEVPAADMWHSVMFEFHPDNRWRMYLDNVLIDEMLMTEDIYGKNLRISVPAKSMLKEPLVSVLDTSPSFIPVRLEPELNSSSVKTGKNSDRLSLPETGKEIFINGIPFVFPVPDENGNDHVDVGQSWVREGTLQGNEEPGSGSFGGRWGGAKSGNRTRLQFVVPYRPFNAIYLLAASQEKDLSIPTVTAQFYRPKCGYPKSFKSGDVPGFEVKTSQSGKPFAVKNASGKEVYLHLVKIPVEPGLLQEFSDMPVIELELTKDAETYRAYPDPLYYTVHGAGLPSAVQVYAMTLGMSPVSVEFNADAYGNVWMEKSVPSYTVRLKNNDLKPRRAKLELAARSFDGMEATKSGREVFLAPNETKYTRFEIDAKRFGHHYVELKVTENGQTDSYRRSFAILRNREYKMRSFDAKGFMFGYWGWNGGHYTPNAEDSIRLMGMMGMESIGFGANVLRDQNCQKLARQFGIRSYWYGGPDALVGSVRTPEAKAKARENKEKEWKKVDAENAASPIPSDLHVPVFAHVYSEPGHLNTHGTFPEFYGEPEREENKDMVDATCDVVRLSAEIAKEKRPGTKMLVPWGDPSFAVPLLKAGNDVTEIIDGVAVDIGSFDRMPELQFHQCSIHRMFQFTETWKKYKQKPPILVTVEGPCITGPFTGAPLSEEEHAAYVMRAALLLGAYGVNRQFAIGSPADSADYWGEQHYNAGFLSRINALNPYPSFSTTATLIRHLRHMEFVDWIPTGSLSVYCLRFRDSRNDRMMYALWTLRGTREVSFKAEMAANPELFDAMDNSEKLPADGNEVGFTLGQMPVFLYGMDGKVSVALGKADHSDAKLGKYSTRTGNAAELFTKQTQQADDEYVNSFPDAVRRFPAQMKLEKVDAPSEYGGKSLAITLPKQGKRRGVMPFYTAILPEKPIALQGAPSHISLWVKGSSDWGRVVFVLRDGKGEKWTSVGTKDAWNCDDTQANSAFNFDGWRLVRFEMPGSAPYDKFRKPGTQWWGSTGGDGIVDLPLSLEKIYVERRPEAMHVNSLVPAVQAAVELGDIFTEYACDSDMKHEAALAKYKAEMPMPPQKTVRVDRIKLLEEAGTLPATKITGVEDPPHYYDGTRGIFSFDEVPDAVRYDIWLSMKPDGSGAIKLGENIKKSGVQINGFRANMDFYAWIVYYDKTGKASKPSAPFRLNMKDKFGMK